MWDRMKNRIGVGVAMAAGLVLSATAVQAQEAPAEAQECRVEVSADAIPVHPDLFEVHATYTESIGDRVAALFQEESQVEVVRVESNEDDPLVVRLTLDTSEAIEGEWSLVLEGEEGQCRGQFKVEETEPQFYR